MNKCIRFCVVGISITLAAASVANASMSEVHAEAWLSSDSSWSPLTVLSNSSYAYAWQDPPYLELSDLESGDITDTYAAVDIGAAGAYAKTFSYYSIESEAIAEPPALLKSHGLGEPYQWWYFQANGPVTFTLNWEVSQNLSTDVVGEYARAWYTIAIVLRDASWKVIDSATNSLTNQVQDGEEGSWSTITTLTVTGSDFKNGDKGIIRFGMQNDA